MTSGARVGLVIGSAILNRYRTPSWEKAGWQVVSAGIVLWDGNNIERRGYLMRDSDWIDWMLVRDISH